MEHTLATSGDGSNTLQLTRFNETYHSKNGAYTEATHIYIRCGLEYLFEKGLQRGSGTFTGNATPAAGINIFDVGLGTALNCILAWCWQQQLILAGKPFPQIAYYGIEKYPIPTQEALQMNYPQVIAEHMEILPDSISEAFTKMDRDLSYNDLQSNTPAPCNSSEAWRILHTGDITFAFEKIHTCGWEKDEEITPGFTLHKSCADISLLKEDYYSAGKYSGYPAMIFYDTFSPATQPELWDESIFRSIAGGCTPGSMLTTYCSKGTVKQALRNAGFTLERLSGPPGQRHILRGVVRDMTLGCEIGM